MRFFRVCRRDLQQFFHGLGAGREVTTAIPTSLQLIALPLNLPSFPRLRAG